MDIKISQPNLMSALSAVAPGAQPNPTFPISINCLINVTANQTTIHTNNGEIYINQLVPINQSIKTGQVLVEHKLLYNWVARTKSNKEIRLTYDTTDKKLHCKAARSHVRLGTTDPKTFPPNVFKSKNKYNIASKFIREGLSTTSNSRIGLPDKLDPSNTNRVINGTHVRISPTYITIEAVSQAYGAFYHTEHGISGITENLDTVLPPKIVGILQTTLPNDDSLMFIETAENNNLVKFKLNNTEWYTSIIAGQYPDTAPFYSTDNKVTNEVDVDSADFRNAIQTAEMFMEEATDAILMWTVFAEDKSPNLVMKSLGNEKGNCEDQLNIIRLEDSDDKDSEFRMAGSIQQLTRISNILKSSETLTLKIKNKSNPSLFITGNNTPNTFYITKPIKVKDDSWTTNNDSN